MKGVREIPQSRQLNVGVRAMAFLFHPHQQNFYDSLAVQQALNSFLCLPFITINHTAYILTEDKNTFA